jgi:DNA primase
VRRPIRHPHGPEGSSFFQKRVPETRPKWLQTAIVSTPNGTTSRALVLADMANVVWAVNLACLGFHLWPYLHDRPEFVDELRLDLEPQPGVDFDDVRTLRLGRDRHGSPRRADNRDRARLAVQGDPWKRMNERPQSLEPQLELHEQDRAAGLRDAPWPPVYPKQPDEPPRVAPSRARKTAR